MVAQFAATGQLPLVRGIAPAKRRLRPANCHPSRMVSVGKAVVAGVGAKMLTGSLLGFVLVFLLLYWLMGGHW